MFRIASALFPMITRIAAFVTSLMLALTIAGGSTGASAQDKAESKSGRDLNRPTLYVVGYAHLDTEWRWEYPQVISEFLPKTMHANFDLFGKYPHYIFNFSGANRYRMMKEYFPADFEQLRRWVKAGRWFPAGSSMEENDVNSPSPESIMRQVLYGNTYFRHEFGVASAEFMLPDCFGFPASLPSILSAAGVKAFSTQKLTWGSAAPVGGPGSPEDTPPGIPFNVGTWDGPGGRSVLAAFNPGDYSGNIYYDLSKSSPQFAREPHYVDWPKRLAWDEKATGVPVDYHYYGTGDTGGSPTESSVRLLEAIVTKSRTTLPPLIERSDLDPPQAEQENLTPVLVGDGPVHVISSKADQMFLDIIRDGKASKFLHYRGDLELTNHSAGSLTSEAAHKRWNRKNELLADAAERASVAAAWLGGPSYPLQRMNDAWALVMGGQFHDIMAGTATPRAYQFSWNDDVIAMNQFAGVVTSATSAVASGLDTEGEGIPLVVYNPLNISRQDVVEARLIFEQPVPNSVRVYGPEGREVPSQFDAATRRVLFLASVPAVGFAIYNVRPADSPFTGSDELKASETSLENARYRLTIDSHGDVASIYDKKLQHELLSAPARLAFQTERPFEWPGWNMDWEDQQKPPRGYVSGPAQVRVVENGPVRVAVEVTRESAGSKFVQTISLAAGDAGNRVEFGNKVDWKTKEAALKATFPLTASNPLATYNWGLGTLQRGNNDPKKFEVASHQWFDLTDKSGAYGVTVLSDCKTGSDKPNDSTLRLTLVYTPGLGLGNGYDYADQSTQDWGHHEFSYGLASHAGDWQHGGTDWQAQRLNDRLIAFQTTPHSGPLGKTFSLLHVDSDHVFVSAVKKAEENDDIVVRVIEMRGESVPSLHISFAGSIIAAHEVNAQEQSEGPVSVVKGALETSLVPYGTRSFELKLAAPARTVPAIRFAPVELAYNVATASEDGAQPKSGFNAAGDNLPTEMLPDKLPYNGIDFHLGPGWTDHPNAVAARGQTIPLPAGSFDRIYILAAADGDQRGTFRLGDRNLDLTIQNWQGFVGQWDTRQWMERRVEIPTPPEPAADDHSWQAERIRQFRARVKEHGPEVRLLPEYTGLTAGYIKRDPIAWYASHYHTAQGANQPYKYCYLFATSLNLPAGATTLTLPDNDKIKVLAVTVAQRTGELYVAHPLYDEIDSSQQETRTR